jgi:hypothetical protein
MARGEGGREGDSTGHTNRFASAPTLAWHQGREGVRETARATQTGPHPRQPLHGTRGGRGVTGARLMIRNPVTRKLLTLLESPSLTSTTITVGFLSSTVFVCFASYFRTGYGPKRFDFRAYTHRATAQARATWRQPLGPSLPGGANSIAQRCPCEATLYVMYFI